MTCAHVLDLIDAGPFAVCPVEHLAAARAHARNCATCGPALATMGQMETELLTLRNQSSVPDFTTAVLSRIAGSRHAQVLPLERATAGRLWQPWLAGVGAAGALAAVAATQWTASALVTTFAPRTGTVTASLVGLMPAEPAAFVVALGLLLYANGLFSLVNASSAPRGGAAGTDSAPR
jgi:hypothetical protein